jgi:uncharacterized protein YeaC (DUF1315 family)
MLSATETGGTSEGLQLGAEQREQSMQRALQAAAALRAA